MHRFNVSSALLDYIFPIIFLFQNLMHTNIAHTKGRCKQCLPFCPTSRGALNKVQLAVPGLWVIYMSLKHLLCKLLCHPRFNFPPRYLGFIPCTLLTCRWQSILFLSLTEKDYPGCPLVVCCHHSFLRQQPEHSH